MRIVFGLALLCCIGGTPPEQVAPEMQSDQREQLALGLTIVPDGEPMQLALGATIVPEGEPIQVALGATIVPEGLQAS